MSKAMAQNEQIFVARPSLPSLERLNQVLEGIWDRNLVTNFGPIETELSRRLSEYLDLPKVQLFSNGHLAIESMLACLPEKGEIITSPFTFPSTVHAIVNTGHTPVLVDVEEGGFGPDPALVEKMITEKTQAILGVHVYGVPCNVEALGDLGKRYRIAVLYDAAHCFGAQHKGRSLISYGDAAAVSTHATKLFHSVEGGFVSVNATRIDAEKIGNFRNFGIADGDVLPTASNAKMSELHAAVGLLNLDDFPDFAEKRKQLFSNFDAAFKGHPLFEPISPSSPNASYYVVRFHGTDEEANERRQSAMEKALTKGIHSRPYFAPSLHMTTAFSKFGQGRTFPHSESLASRLLCLPMFDSMTQAEQSRIIEAFDP